MTNVSATQPTKTARPADADELLARWNAYELHFIKSVGGYPGYVWEAVTPVVGLHSTGNDGSGECYGVAMTWAELREELDHYDFDPDCSHGGPDRKAGRMTTNALTVEREKRIRCLLLDIHDAIHERVAAMLAGDGDDAEEDRWWDLLDTRIVEELKA